MLVDFASVLGIGIALKRYMVSSNDFLLSGRAIPAWVCGLAFISADLGTPEVIGMAASRRVRQKSPRRILSRDDLASGSADDWRRPACETEHLGNSAACKEPWRYLLDPEIFWEKLSPQERAAIEALDRETMANTRARLERIRAQRPLRE